MDMKEFATKVCAAMQKTLGQGCRVEAKDVRKNNGVVRHGLVILSQGENVAPTIYLEAFLEAYEHGMPFRTVIQKITDAYVKSVPGEGVDLDFFRSFEKVKDRICYRLIRRKGNEELLEQIPYVDFLDLAICFYYSYQGESLGNGNILIYNSHAQMWGTGTEELYALAGHNTQRLFPWVCRSLDEVVQEAIKAEARECGVEDDGVPLLETPLKVPMKVLSNVRQAQGAACILYPGVLEALARKEGCGFYILPSSIHEVVLLPDKRAFMVPEELRQMIKDINSTQVVPEEVLSDSLYYYDAARKQVSIIL